MSQSAKAQRPARPSANPDIALVHETPASPAEKPAPKAPDSAAPPPVTVEDPWRNLHPSRIWPD